MKYTRKEVLKKAGIAGLTLFTPSLITVLYNYINSDSTLNTTFDEANKEFNNDLEDWFKYYSRNDLKLDILIINDQSIENYDFVFLTYNRELNDAPLVAIPKNEDYYPDCIRQLKADVKILKKFSENHGIFIYDGNEGFKQSDTIERIRDCGLGNCISDDLYRPVAFAYAALYKHVNNDMRIGLS